MSISFSTPSTPSNKILGSLHPAYESSTHDGSIHEGDESHDSNSSQTSKPHSSESSEIPLDSTFENSINNIKTYTDFKNALKSLSYRNEVLGCEHMAPFLKILLEKKQDLLFNLKNKEMLSCRMLFREFRISQTESVTKEKAYLLTKISAPKPGEQLSSEDKHTLLVARAVLRPEESTLGILPEEISKMQANMETFEQVFSEKYQNFQELATTINMLKRAIELRTIDKTAPIKPLSELKKQNESCCVIS